MKFAFDFGETITQNPVLFEELFYALKIAGHSVHVVSAVSRNVTAAQVESKLRAIGVSSYTFVYVCPADTLNERAKLKAAYAAREKPDFFIDDCGLYCEAVKVASPGTFLAWVMRGDSWTTGTVRVKGS